MSMYLSNQDLHTTGLEPAEFIDVPPMGEDVTAVPPLLDRLRRRAPERLDNGTRSTITRWAEEYISSLVENRNGDVEDVRAVIRDLHHAVFADAATGW